MGKYDEGTVRAKKRSELDEYRRRAEAIDAAQSQSRPPDQELTREEWERAYLGSPDLEIAAAESRAREVDVLRGELAHAITSAAMLREALRALVDGVTTTCPCVGCTKNKRFCPYCGQRAYQGKQYHKPDCPVTVAEETLEATSDDDAT